MNTEKFKAMGRVFLYGADGNVFALRRTGGRQVSYFEAIEDESDGYRSCLAEVKELAPEEVTQRKLVFPRTPIVRAIARDREKPLSEYGDGFDGIEFVDASGHVWLIVGTDNSDDYYPSFVFTWMPKAVTP